MTRGIIMHPVFEIGTMKYRAWFYSAEEAKAYALQLGPRFATDEGMLIHLSREV